MISDVFGMFVESLKGKKYWKTLQPYILFGFASVAAQVLAYQYVLAEYGFSPSLGLYFKSYFFLRINVATAGLALVVALFQIGSRRRESSLPGKVQSYFRRNRSLILLRVTGLFLIGIAVVIGFRRFGPAQVSTIQVKLLGEIDGFKPEALAYLIYELNRQQRNWYFEMDITEQVKDEMPSSLSDNARPQFTWAEFVAKGRPTIAITTNSLAPSFFCQHLGNVSVISTCDNEYEPLSVYEYLSYCLVVQSILIHLDVNGGGLPSGAFEPGSASHGGVFQFNPSRELLRATILAARLSPTEEALLFNRFGADYMNVCRRLLTLEWLRSERVVHNLSTYFGLTNAVTSPVPSLPSHEDSPASGDK